MPRPSPPSSGLAALLAAALLAFAVAPAAGAVADALGDDDRSYCERMGHTMPPETPDNEPFDPAACCVSAPEAPRDAIVPAPSPVPEEAVAAALVVLPPPPTAPASGPAPRDTGPPSGPRLHLALSVFLV